MRRRTVALAGVMAVVCAACTDKDRARAPAGTEAGRESTRPVWERVPEPSFAAGASTTAIDGVAAAGDGYAFWTVAGTVTDQRSGRRAAVVWSSSDGRQWRRVDLDSGGRPSIAMAVARRQGSAVVVGSVQSPAGDHDGAAWTSTDGATWRPVVMPAEVGGGPGDQEINEIGSGPLGFVAVGIERRDGRLVPAVWSSPDGTAWSRATGGDAPFRADQAVNGVAVGRAGAVVVGSQPGSGDSDAAIWFSSDAKVWRQATADPAVLGGPGNQQALAAAATAGGFVAVGSSAGASGADTPAVWTSTDGTTWQRAPASPDLSQLPDHSSSSGVVMNGVADGGSLVAVGGNQTANQVWTSPDGRRWTRQQVPDQLRGSWNVTGPVATDGRSLLVALNGTVRPLLWFRPAGGTWVDVTDAGAFLPAPRALTISDVVRHSGSLFAFGVDADPADVGRHGERVNAAVWRSADGRGWQRVPDPDGTFRYAYTHGATGWRGGLVAVGAIDTADELGHIGAVWTSSDGTSWRRVDRTIPSFAAHQSTTLQAVAPGGAGLVAVGITYGFNQPLDAHAWTSADGLAWQPAREPPAWSGPEDQTLSAVCPLPGGGVVAVGYSRTGTDQNGWAWLSQDGIAWDRAADDAALGGPGHQYPTACASTSSGVLAAGSDNRMGNDTDAAVWASADGRTWRRAGDPAALARTGSNFLNGIAADGARVAAVGYDEADLIVFTSTDGGATWRREEGAGFGGFGYQQGNAAVVSGEQAIVVGQDDYTGALWVGRVPSR